MLIFSGTEHLVVLENKLSTTTEAEKQALIWDLEA